MADDNNDIQKVDDLEMPEGTYKPIEAPLMILGAGANIGLGLARRFADEGRHLILSYRSRPDDVVELQMRYPKQIQIAALDARSSSAVERIFEKISFEGGKLSGLINCIGPFLEKPLKETEDADFEDMVQGNLVQAFAAARRAYPLLCANGGGSIIHFTFAGLEKISAYDKIGAYAAAKVGLLSLTRSMAVEWAGDQVRVNSIAPGITETAPVDQMHLKKHIPQGRLASLDDIYQAVRFLISPEARHITGTNLTVSGGFGWKYP